MSNGVKQVIVMRTDLGMRKGKMVAQGAHASTKFLTDRMQRQELGGYYSGFSEVEAAWIEGSFTKVCVRVNSLEELLEIASNAENKGVRCSLIQDSGKTEFHGVPTYTCLALGPDLSENIDPITGHLELL